MYTIGYGGRRLSEFIELVKNLRIEMIIDVRRWNKSRRNPEFSGSNLETTLTGNGIMYQWIPSLGGYRKFGVDVDDFKIASCFESQGFRAYATYITLSPVVRPYLKELLDYALRFRVALLCAEKYPWYCHRKILSDYLLAKGFKVIHVISEKETYEHKLSRCAVIEDNELVYI